MLLVAMSCWLLGAEPLSAQPTSLQSDADRSNSPSSAPNSPPFEGVSLNINSVANSQSQSQSSAPNIAQSEGVSPDLNGVFANSQSGEPTSDSDAASTTNSDAKAGDDNGPQSKTNGRKYRLRPGQKLKERRSARKESQQGSGGIRKGIDVNVPYINNTPTESLPIPFDASSISGQALNLILNKKVDQAKTMLTDAYNAGKRDGKLDPEYPYFLAAIEAHTERYSQALKYLSETQSIREKQKLDVRSNVLLMKRIGDCYYRNHDLKEALSNYKAAMFMAQQDASLPPVLTSEILESIVGCETRLKDYAAAERDCRNLIASTRAQLNGGGVPAVLSYSWSMIQLAEILKRAGRRAEFEVAQTEWQSLVSQIVQMRSIAENAGVLPEFDEVTKLFRVAYIQAMAPKTPADIAWAGNDFRIKSMPIIVWRPAGQPLAAIICVHGLGLDNHSFTHTAKQLTARGYIVAALDVRGFGAWVNTRGEEDLDYDLCIGDIKDAVSIFKKKNPGIPIYVLGESMGGAIALRAAAKLGSEINGVISSVPSAERFQKRKMSLQTAMHFIADPRKPFDVGDYVAERATSQEATREEWAKDSKARLDLSPIELMKFAVFMRTTKRCAEDIKDVPVLMLQGLKDRLVKPKGTFELFEAVNSEDKSMIVQGLSEHLMFETPNPDPSVIDAVDSWLKQRSLKK